MHADEENTERKVREAADTTKRKSAAPPHPPLFERSPLGDKGVGEDARHRPERARIAQDRLSNLLMI